MSGWRKRQIQMQQEKDLEDTYYELGWNSALDTVAFKLINDFRLAFGEDTLASIAAWIKEQKK